VRFLSTFGFLFVVRAASLSLSDSSSPLTGRLSRPARARIRIVSARFARSDRARKCSWVLIADTFSAAATSVNILLRFLTFFSEKLLRLSPYTPVVDSEPRKKQPLQQSSFSLITGN
jgi:hypothetical protein